MEGGKVRRNQVRRIGFLLIVCLAPLLLGSWGFYAHRLINHTAVFSLPADLAVFYKQFINYITEHAIDPDKRCYIDSLESPRHFIDLDDLVEDGTVDSIPIHWSKAVEKFTERKLRAVGIVPWQIERSYAALREAMYRKDLQRILRHSADLGHYLADAHVPLHTTKNYNGQFTNQVGIHAFWETRLPERFSPEYDLWVGKASYVPSVLDEAWKIVKDSNQLLDSVLGLEKALDTRFPKDRKYAFVLRNNILQRNYSENYAAAYHQDLNGMVERRMRESIRQVANYWYSAWTDAGRPDLSDLMRIVPMLDTLNQPQPGQKNLGRPEWH